MLDKVPTPEVGLRPSTARSAGTRSTWKEVLVWINGSVYPRLRITGSGLRLQGRLQAAGFRVRLKGTRPSTACTSPSQCLHAEHLHAIPPRCWC